MSCSRKFPLVINLQLGSRLHCCVDELCARNIGNKVLVRRENWSDILMHPFFIWARELIWDSFFLSTLLSKIECDWVVKVGERVESWFAKIRRVATLSNFLREWQQARKTNLQARLTELAQSLYSNVNNLQSRRTDMRFIFSVHSFNEIHPFGNTYEAIFTTSYTIAA